MIAPTRYSANIDIGRQQRLSAAIGRDREAISTQHRIARPSDDTAGTARLSALARRETQSTAWAANAERARGIAASADSALGSAQTVVDRAIETLSAAISATASPQGRAVAADVLDSLAAELDELRASTDSDGSPLFPAQTPLSIPISETLNVQATLSASDAFAVALPSGSNDIAAILRAAATSLRDGSSTALAAARTSFDDLATARDHLASTRGTIGIAAARIDATIDRLSDQQLAIDEEREGIDGVDLAATIARIQSNQLTLEAAQGLFARLNRATLFDLLG